MGGSFHSAGDSVTAKPSPISASTKAKLSPQCSNLQNHTSVLAATNMNRHYLPDKLASATYAKLAQFLLNL